MKITRLVALCCVAFLMTVGFAPAANAASAWDNVYNRVDSITIRDDSSGCLNDLDITTTWASIVAASDAGNSFAIAQQNGRWGVSKTFNTFSGQRTDVVAVYWTEDASGHVNFIGDGITVGEEVVFQGDGSNVHVVFINQKPDDCGTGYVYWDFITTQMTVSTFTDVVNYSFGWANLFVNANVYYPHEYEGSLIPSEYIAPSPVTYTGSVDCFGENPLAMIIDQGTNDGSATLTPESLGRATWEYTLTSAPYSIAVNCGGTWAYSDGSVSPSSTSGDWVCDPYTIRYDLAYCVLS